MWSTGDIREFQVVKLQSSSKYMTAFG